MDWKLCILAILGSGAAGFINTLAGSGSVITLPLLMALGLPANIANGTNRLGILAQTSLAVVTLFKKGKLKLSREYLVILPTLPGAIAGAFIAVEIDETALRYSIGTMMLIMLIPTLLNAEKWLRKTTESQGAWKNPLFLLFFLAIGVYGGFIQAGMGVISLIVMVLWMKYDLVTANGIKNLMVFCFTVPVLAIFIWKGQVNWQIGALMVIGQGVGGWAAARFASDSPQAVIWIRRLLIVVIVVSVVEMFGLREWLFQYF
ncbi:MAG: sulfite exporter TauE/SafE family protein [Bacteroidia bacterium]|nr:sulfite exporter TauE/SafE family protein [Bacteroidia bacterium]